MVHMNSMLWHLTLTKEIEIASYDSESCLLGLIWELKKSAAAQFWSRLIPVFTIFFMDVTTLLLQSYHWYQFFSSSKKVSFIFFLFIT